MSEQVKFKAFQTAVEMMASVAVASIEFKARELEAALNLQRYVCVAASVEECRQPFAAAYRSLGAPGDFGYDSPEGTAMANLYRAWNEALQERKALDADAAVDRVAMGA